MIPNNSHINFKACGAASSYNCPSMKTGQKKGSAY